MVVHAVCSMIKEVDMNVAFPEYKGGKDLNNALEFIQSMCGAAFSPRSLLLCVCRAAVAVG